jgi:FMN phosphatase YigB (HAD superfamily)
MKKEPGQMSHITTVIFDMYDTLVLNDPLRWKATFEEIIREQGLDTDVDRLREVWREADLEFRSKRDRPGAPGSSAPSIPLACLETRRLQSTRP